MSKRQTSVRHQQERNFKFAAAADTTNAEKLECLEKYFCKGVAIRMKREFVDLSPRLIFNFLPEEFYSRNVQQSRDIRVVNCLLTRHQRSWINVLAPADLFLPFKLAKTGLSVRESRPVQFYDAKWTLNVLTAVYCVIDVCLAATSLRDSMSHAKFFIHVHRWYLHETRLVAIKSLLHLIAFMIMSLDCNWTICRNEIKSRWTTSAEVKFWKLLDVIRSDTRD